MAGKGWAWIFTWVVGISQINGDVLKSIGNLNFTCPDGWQFVDSTCYMPVSTIMEFEDATDTCKRYFANLTIMEDEIENKALTDKASSLGWNSFWNGEKITDRCKGYWDVNQPSAATGAENCAAIFQNGRWKIVSCSSRLPFFCKKLACIDGTFDCGTGRCLSNNWLCDGVNDCGNNLDEMKCKSNCTETQTGVSDRINFNKNAGNTDCTWTLVSPPGSQLVLTFSTIRFSGSDSLEVRIGGQTLGMSRLLDTLSGSHDNQILYSNNNMAVLRFVSDSSNTNSQFQMSWTSNDQNLTTTTISIAADNDWKSLTSPFYPNSPPSGFHKEWLVSSASIVTAKIDKPDLSPDWSLVIYDGEGYDDVIVRANETSDLVAPSIYMSRHSKIRVVLKAKDTSDGGKGIRIRVKRGCSVDVEATSGVLTSPGYLQSDYPASSTCSWTIHSPPGSTGSFKLKFLELNLHDDGKDKIEIYDSLDATGTALHPSNGFQGDLMTSLPSVTGNSLYVVFTSSVIQNNGRFKFEFSIDCPAIPDSPNLSISSNDSSYNSKVEVTCQTGYSFPQEELYQTLALTFTCMKGGNWDRPRFPTCQIVYCGAPPPIEFGYVSNYSGDATYRSTATYTCYDGFTLDGSTEVECQENGNWSSRPSCTSSVCGDPPVVDHARKVGNGTSYGTVIEYECDEGYEILSSPRILCQKNTSWSQPTPTCTEKLCPLPNIENSLPLSETSPVKFGVHVEVSCKTGYVASSTNTTSASLTCKSNQTFDLITCTDKNECDDTPCERSETCMNTEGSYSCVCKPGYRMGGDGTCLDIDECAEGSSGCDTCVNTEGSYSCSCSPGFSLFVNGTSGIHIKQGETGEMTGDVYRENHTCVRNQCPRPNDVMNGIIHSQKQMFWFEDEITYSCELGYVLGGSTMRTVSRQCESDGSWSGSDPVCQAVTCTAQTREGTEAQKDQVHGIYPRTEVQFRDTVIIECKNTDGSTFNKTRFCAYDASTHAYTLQGDSPVCPVVDCGPQENIAGQVEITLNSTVYGSTFEFECETGATRSGLSTSANYNVTCQRNGHWGYGNLTCKAAKCSDPGTLGGTIQNKKSYEQGQVVTYECERPGFEPTPDPTIKCVYHPHNGTATWNNTAPSCQDTTPPKFENGTVQEVWIDRMEAPLLSPVVEDNSGLVVSISTPMLPGFEASNPVTDNLTVDYTAMDGIGKTQRFQYLIYVRDYTPGTLNCTPHIQLQANTSTTTYNMADYITYSRGRLIPDLHLTTSLDRVGQVTYHRMSLQTEHGTVTTCAFSVEIVASACYHQLTSAPANGRLEPSSGNTGDIFTVAVCNDGFAFSDGATRRNYTCTGQNEWTPAMPIEDCQPYSTSGYSFFVKLDLNTTSRVFTDSTCMTDFKNSYNTSVSAQLDYGICRLYGSFTEHYRFTVTQINYNLKPPYENEVELTLRVENSDGSLESLQACQAQINIVKNMLFKFDGCGFTVQQSSLGVNESRSGESCDPGDALTPVDGSNKCLPCPLGFMYMSSSGQCVQCPSGQYQDEAGQSSCKPCSTGQVSIAPRTSRDHCIDQCRDGFVSTSGSPPCSPCPVDNYWENSTLCSPCPNGGSTLYTQAAANISMCAAPCPTGQYSQNVYKPCRSCPRNFYQEDIGQIMCIECATDEITDNTGSTAASDCKSAGDNDTCLSNCDSTGTDTCQYLYHRAFCTCKQGYTGTRCDSTIDYCLSNPCLNEATCTSDTNGFTCSCQKERVCEMELNSVKFKDANPSLGHRYHADDNEVTCKSRCVSLEECVAAVFKEADSNSCSLLTADEDISAKTGESGTDEAWGRYFDKNCSVKAFFDGDHCERDLRNDCKSNTCSDNGVCRDLVNATECVCSTSGTYSGANCLRDTDLCLTDNCENGGTCTEWGDIRHQCTCLPGYTGNRCQTPIDECGLNPEGCLYSGQCVDAVDSYSCNCSQGSGQHCEVITPLCPSDQCQHGLCVHNYQTATAECVCEHPYENNTEGGCSLMDFCASSPCVSSNSERCDNSVDGYHCVCLSGYQGSRCQHNTDDCVGNTCEHGRCEDGNDTYTCVCEPGYTGSNCESNIDDCSGQCANENASGCTDLLQDYVCNCLPGYAGKNCTEEINECDSLPCQHGGTCVDEFNSFRCNCTEGWEGDTCEREMNQCGGVTCQNDAECFNLLHNYFCSCPPGTEGELCGTSPEVCTLLDPCTPRGTCQQLGGAASCNCSANPDYTGLSCELIKDSCKDLDTCKNGGTCVLSNPTGHTCTCPPGFSGPTCEVVEDVCDSRCPAGVKCVQEDKLTFCLCPAQQVLTNTGCQDSSSDFDLFLDAELSSQPLESAPFRLSGNITLMFWVGYFNGKRSVYLSDVTDDEQYVEMYEDQIQFGSVDEGNVTLDPNKNLKTIDGQWDHVAITWSASGHFVVYINAIQVKEDDIGFGLSSTKLKRIRIDSTFTGYVSQISVWSTILSNSDIASSIINTSFIPVGVRTLGWTSGFKMTTGTKRYTPSRAANGRKLCDSGRIRSDTCDGARDKTAPLFNDCPSEHILTRVSDKRVVERKDVITSPSSGDLPILSTLTDDVLSWGRYDVVFAAKDATGNYGLCRFKTYITERGTCDVTGFTQQTACGENAIEGFCSSDYLPSVPSPNVLQCSKRGSFNLDQPLEPFVTPVCGEATSQMFRLEVTLTYALLLPCNEFSSRSTQSDVKAKLVNDIRRKWPELCSDCDTIPIVSTCDGNNVKMTLSFSDLPELLTKSDDTVSLKADEVFLTTVKESDELDLSSATLQKNDVQVLLSPSCSGAVGTDKCVSCGAGTYYNSTAQGCVYCPPGSYTSSLSETSCTPCSDGHITLSPGARDVDQCVEKCPAGQYYEEEECKLCPVGFYQHEEGKSFCYPCPPNKITSRTGTDETDKCFDDCPSGTELQEDSTCKECSQGYYRTQSIHDKCQPCMGNTTEGPRSKSASDCILPDCGPGHYINDLRECVECEEGSYQPIEWQRQCTNCSENFTTENKGSTNSSECRFVCTAGSELADEGSQTCNDCPVGRYRDESLEHRFLPCQNCSAEFTTAGTGSNNGSDCAIKICYAGSYRNETDNTCAECPVGEYQPEDLKTQCIACPANYTTVGRGSTNQSHCQFFCPNGYEILSAEDETCQVCPRGTFHSRGDGLTTRCVNCSADRTTDTTGAKTDAECNIGVCSAGQFLVNLLGCDDCPLDTYQPEALPTSISRCHDCGTGKGTEKPRSISESECKPFCVAGQQYNSSSGQCEDCPQGTYNTGSTLTRFKQCAACPDENMTTVGTGSISAENCTIRNCEAGYRRTSDNKCVECGFGFYQPERAKDTCMECGPKLNTSSETATQRDDCTVSCGVGEQGQDGNCSSCPDDTYKDTDGYAICSPCTGNFTSDETRTSCTITFCDKGFGKKADDTCEECAKGFYKESRGNLDCSQCPKNFTTESSGATSVADCSQLHCEPGLFGNGTDECVLCPSGFYKNITGPQACTQCSADKTTEGEGAINELQCSVALCEAGHYRTSSNVCAKCDKGSYQESRGATDCNTCREGTTTKTDGATSINDCLIMCAAGQYRSSPNECSVCDVGQYQPNPSSESCFNCTEGYTTLGNASTREMDCLRNCPAGQFRESSQRESCTLCPVGQYQSASGLTECIKCEEGFTTLGKASNSSDDCLPVCPPGRYLNVSSRSCSPCDLGTYKESAGVQEECTPCPTDTTTAASGANSSSQCDIDDCRAGYHRAESGRGCQMCGRGRYQPLKSQPSCIPCGDDLTTRLGVLDATSAGQCIVDCREGEERDLQNTSVCRKCPNGQYRKKELSDSCTFCPVGQTTMREGATSCVPYSPDVTKAPRKVLLKVKLRFTLKTCVGLNFDVLRQRITERIKLRIDVQVLQFPGLCSLGCANVKIKITVPCSEGLRKKRQTTTNVKIDTIVELENVASQLADRNDTILRSTASVLEEVLGDESLIDSPLKNFGVEYDQITEISDVPQECVEGATLDDTDKCVWCVKGTQYLTSPIRCEACPVGQYQDTIGQKACKQCLGKLSTRRNGSSSLQECISVCILEPDYCQHEGICRNSSVDDLSCLCTEKYTGDRCEMRLAVESDLPAIIIGVCVGIFCVLLAILVIGWCCYKRRPHKQDKDNWSRITPPIDYIDYQTPALTPRSHLQMHKHIQFPNSSYSRSDVHDFYQSEWE